MTSRLLPHSVALFVLSITSVALGYYVGKSRAAKPNSSEQFQDEEPEDESLAAVPFGLFEQCKLVLVVRTDLKLSPGTIFAQCGHATLACYRALMKNNPQLVKHWERTGQAKIALKGTSEKQLLELETSAKNLNICARSVSDPESSRTVLAIGPAPVELINRVTGKLRLL